MGELLPWVKTGFVAQELFSPKFMAKVFRIACPAKPRLGSMDVQDLGVELSELIAQTDEEGGTDTTIVLEVIDGKSVPRYIDEAIELLLEQRARLGLIVVCDGATTHDHDSSLPMVLCAHINEVNRRGLLWNPVSERIVPARPSALF